MKEENKNQIKRITIIIQFIIIFILALSIFSENEWGHLRITETGLCTSVDNRTIRFGAVSFHTAVQCDDYWVGKTIQFDAYLEDGFYYPMKIKEGGS